jgi:hypothetical protein
LLFKAAPSDRGGQLFSNDGHHFHGGRGGLVTKAAALLSEKAAVLLSESVRPHRQMPGIAAVVPFARACSAAATRRTDVGLVIVGTQTGGRPAIGDVCNTIGSCLKALAAHDDAMPSNLCR